MILLSISAKECWKGVVDKGTTTALATAAGGAAPAATQSCAGTDDQCFYIRVKCAAITDATKKAIACAADKTQSQVFGCAQDAADQWCQGGTFGIAAGVVGGAGNAAYPLDSLSTQVISKCCASSTVDCNKPTKCQMGAVGMGTSKFQVDLTGLVAPVTTQCAPDDDRCFRVAIDCTKVTDAAQKLVLCKDVNTVTATSWGCAKNHADSVCNDLAVRANGGTTQTKDGLEGFKFVDAEKVSATCCDGNTTHDCNNTVNCWQGMVDAGTVTASSNFMNTLVGTAAPASKECAVADDYCVAIILDCSKETDAAQKLVVCKAADTTRAEQQGCAKDDAAKWCPSGAQAIAAGKGVDGVAGFKALGQTEACCAGQAVANCNKLTSCNVGGKDTGSATADGKSMNLLTKTAQTPATGVCAPGQTQCVVVTIDCSKETDAAQKLVFCKIATTAKAYYQFCASKAAEKWCPAGTYTVPTALNDAVGDADFKGATDAQAGVCCDAQLKADCNTIVAAAAGEGEAKGETKKGEGEKAAAKKTTTGETTKKKASTDTKKKDAAGESLGIFVLFAGIISAFLA